MNTDANVIQDDVRARREAAFAMADQGRVAEAERAFESIVRDAPDDVDALNFLAVAAHGRGRRDEAIALLRRALEVEPAHAVSLTNLGVLHREAGRIDDAHDALAAAVRAAPQSYVARLRFAEVLQARNRKYDALAAYFGAIKAAQGHGLWMNEATTPPPLRPLVLHAMRVVESGRRELFGGLLRPLRERYGGAAMARVEKALAMYLGERPLELADPEQRPRFFYFPDLPARRFFDRALFPWYADLESNTDVIREEMLAALTEDSGFEPFLGHNIVPGSGGAPPPLLHGNRGAPAWNALFFYRHGVRYDANARRCPRSAAALDAAPLCRVREHAPEVCFSVLTPGSQILPHRGVTNTRIVTHLPLVVPSDCALVVAGEKREWREGECFSFDDTFEHEAWNRSDATRVVVLLDAWNPYLTEVEKEAVAELVGGIGDFNRAAELH